MMKSKFTEQQIGLPRTILVDQGSVRAAGRSRTVLELQARTMSSR